MRVNLWTGYHQEAEEITINNNLVCFNGLSYQISDIDTIEDISESHNIGVSTLPGIEHKANTLVIYQDCVELDESQKIPIDQIDLIYDID